MMIDERIECPVGARPAARLIYGVDVREGLRMLDDESIDTVVTSPPYWGLRDYDGPEQVWGGDPRCDHVWSETATTLEQGNKRKPKDIDKVRQRTPGRDKASPQKRVVHSGQCTKCGAWRGKLGLEPTPEMFIEHLADVFDEVWRVLKPAGTIWVNLGDSYASNAGGGPGDAIAGDLYERKNRLHRRRATAGGELKQKDLVGIPWMFAFEMRARGWYLRSDIVWCLSGGAWVYARTQKGEMPVMIKDLVRLDPSTVSLWNGEKWTQVLGWGPSSDLDEKMELVLRSGERIGCTGSHLWPTNRGLVEARNLRCGDVLETCTLPSPSSPMKLRYMTEDVAWLLGLFLAEGSRSGDTIQISLNRSELHFLPRIESAVESLGGSVAHDVTGESLNVRCYGRVLDAVLREFIGGRTAKDKHLRVSCWSLPTPRLRDLMSGYLDGDGHYDARARRWRLGFTRNYHLERDLRVLAARLGAVLTLKPVKATGFGRSFAAFKGEWRWNYASGPNAKDRSEVVELRKSRARKFWDISVADEPHTFALASGVLTHNCKPNPMPESVVDRPTKSHEYIFLLSKSRRYFFDMDGYAEPASGRYPGNVTHKHELAYSEGDEHMRTKGGLTKVGARATRNRRTVWSVSTKPYAGSHFAVFPPDLIEPCILAGSSEHGCCSACGAPHERVVERVDQGWDGAKYGERAISARGKPPEYDSNFASSTLGSSNGKLVGQRVSVGWKPTCSCDADVELATVLDPFAGTSTVGQVCFAHGRNFVGIDLDASNIELARRRLFGQDPKRSKAEAKDQMKLF